MGIVFGARRLGMLIVGLVLAAQTGLAAGSNLAKSQDPDRRQGRRMDSAPKDRGKAPAAGEEPDRRARRRKMMAERKERDKAPALGAEAPSFKLKKYGGQDENEVELASFKGSKPVVLVFGSYT